MDAETTRHVQQLGTWLYNNMAATWFAVCFVAGGAYWWLRQVFVTRAAVEALKEVNSQQHDRIGMSIDSLREDMHSKHTQLLNTILELHSKDRE